MCTASTTGSSGWARAPRGQSKAHETHAQSAERPPWEALWPQVRPRHRSRVAGLPSAPQRQHCTCALRLLRAGKFIQHRHRRRSTGGAVISASPCSSPEPDSQGARGESRKKPHSGQCPLVPEDSGRDEPSERVARGLVEAIETTAVDEHRQPDHQPARRV